jgi:hypothetical protein
MRVHAFSIYLYIIHILLYIIYYKFFFNFYFYQERLQARTRIHTYYNMSAMRYVARDWKQIRDKG